MPTSKYLIPIRLLCLLSALLAVSLPLRADHAQAYSLLQQGRVDEAAALLHETVNSQPDNAKARQLLCRVYYAQEMADAAIRECELAAAADPNDSDTADVAGTRLWTQGIASKCSIGFRAREEGTQRF